MAPSTGEPIVPGAFRGWSEDAIDFFEEAVGHESWQWVQAQREWHERSVRGPMVDLMVDLAEEFGPGHIWHLHRDPYLWTHQVAEVAVAGRVGLRVILSLDGLAVFGGFVRPSPDQLAAYRSAVAGPDGVELQRAVDRLRAAGWDLGGDTLATRPRNVPADHPRLELLRHRSLALNRSWDVGVWLDSREPYRRVRDAWRDLGPVTGWLAAVIAPAEPFPGR